MNGCMDECADGGEPEKHEAVWLQQMEEQQVSGRGGSEAPIVSVPH